ncbi:hypothetical protein CUZ56_01387 [Saezia sanguinis]|uniref:Integrating conjugative element protein n=1 Tax=Saezia sanguinis TaxID=1965230 RepID=A0A433SFE2_9BURK|nr:TIGR03761 family integrating conjugative element protein [Saezia sanguinis]RUS67442.1 hypothetical protein CUZ56_01387 [Saezia sanguinis]
MPSNLQLNLGALRSSMQLTLHTHHATRLWHGRQPANGKPLIIGLNAYLSITNKMIRGAAQDDPYSDMWMIRVEERIDAIKDHFQHIREILAEVFKGVPVNLSLGDNLNIQPVSLPIFASSPLGFLAIYLIAEYDEIVRRLLLAQHVALIDRATLDTWLDDGAHELRSLFALVQQYQYSGTRRDDYAAKNAAASNAIEKFGELPQDVLEGTRRSRYAPPIIRPTEPYETVSIALVDNEPQKLLPSEPENAATDISAENREVLNEQ